MSKIQQMEVPLSYVYDLCQRHQSRRHKTVIRDEFGDIEFHIAMGKLNRLMEHPICVKCGCDINHAIIIPACTRTNSVNCLAVGHLSSDETFTQFTLDHILPKSLGGNFTIFNTQVMCETCNGKKQDIMPLSDIQKIRLNVEQHMLHYLNPDLIELLLNLKEVEALLMSNGVNKDQYARLTSIIIMCKQMLKSSSVKAWNTVDAQQYDAFVGDKFKQLMKTLSVNGWLNILNLY